MQQLSDRQDGVSVRVSRRSFLQAGVVAGGTWVGATMQQQPVRAGEPVSLKEGAVILFQGDSITDAGRIRKAKGPNDLAGLGRGYPLLLAGALLSEYPQKQLQIFNRGISGNKVPDLDRRWEKDTLALKPDVLSILIGVNDIWHKLSGRYNGTVEDYETGYRALLKRTLEALPDVRIVICEPFVL